jgi:hypothetical protein
MTHSSLPFVWHSRGESIQTRFPCTKLNPTFLSLTVLLPVVRLFRRKKDAAALIRTVRGQDPSKIKILVPGYRVWPSDVDYNMHKSNSTYASDMDVARSTVSPLVAAYPHIFDSFSCYFLRPQQNSSALSLLQVDFSPSLERRIGSCTS